MGSTADQYQDRPAGLLLWFVLVCRSGYVALCRVVCSFKTNYNYTRLKVPSLRVVSLYSCICSGFLQQYISCRLTVNDFTGPRSTSASPSVAHN